MTVPIVGNIMGRIPANEKMIVSRMGMMGEKETIVNYPKMIEALVATNNDPVASNAARTEFSAFANFLGFRTNMKIRAGDLAQLSMPTLMIWGERDPLGTEDVAQAISEAIPNCVLEVLPTGHEPWLGYPVETAKLIQDFVLQR
jgi:2-hydroxy-6-oxonona-2,4-dienedioate hydrolase